THGFDEETQYVELALGLIDAVDAPTRAAVASRLLAYPGAPAAILRKLANGPPPATGAGEGPEGCDLIELFFSAPPEERRLILINLDVASATTTQRAMPTAGELVRRLESAALKRNQGEFVRVLERALGIGRELAERVARDNSGEPVVVAAKALGIKAEVLQRILLFLNPVVGQSARRLYELSHLFDELNPAAAARMVSIWRTTAPRHPVHEPVYWNDERPGPRPAARPAPNRAPSRDERPARSRSSDR